MGAGKRKLEIKRIEKESSRMVTFSKRKKGLFKKAQELQSKTGSTIFVIVFSPAGKPYCHGDPVSIDTALNAILNYCNVRSQGSAAAFTSTAVVGSNCDRIVPVTLTTHSEEGLNGGHGGRGSGLDGTGTFAQSTSGNCNGVELAVNNCCSTSYGFDERWNLDGGRDEKCTVSGFLVDGFGGTGHGFSCSSAFVGSTSQESDGFGLMVDDIDHTSDGFLGTNTFALSTSGNSNEFEFMVNNFDCPDYGFTGTTTFAASTSENNTIWGLANWMTPLMGTSENCNGLGPLVDNGEGSGCGFNRTSETSYGFGL